MIMDKGSAFISVFLVTIIWGILLIIEGVKLGKLPDAKLDNFKKDGGIFLLVNNVFYRFIGSLYFIWRENFMRGLK